MFHFLGGDSNKYLTEAKRIVLNTLEGREFDSQGQL